MITRTITGSLILGAYLVMSYIVGTLTRPLIQEVGMDVLIGMGVVGMFATTYTVSCFIVGKE